VTAREVIAYAITHAPRGQKGGPYEGPGRPGHTVAQLSHAFHYKTAASAREDAEWIGERACPVRVIRIVRKARPSEASAVEVLRELVAHLDKWSDDSLPVSRLMNACIRIEVAARRVLASAGPDPMPVVRAALAWVDSRDSADRGRETSALYRSVDAYRKAGGK